MRASLEQRLKTLMAVRLVMVTTLLLVAAYSEAISDTLLPFSPFFALIGATYALTVVHALLLRFLSRRLEPLVYVQVIGDLVIITGLVYLTGGSRAGFALLYPIAVLAGGTLLTRRSGGLTLAGLATVFYAGLLLSVRAGKLSPQGLIDVPDLSLRSLLYSIFVTGVACATVAVIGSYLASSLRSTSEQLEERTGQVADLQQLTQAIVSSIHSGLITADPGGRILFVNQYGRTILGRSPSELLGRSVREVFGPQLATLRTAEDLARIDVAYERGRDDSLELGVSVSPLATTEGGHLLVFQDLTSIKRLEREVRAKEKLAAVGEMAAQLAHEIRNPLGSISGSAQVLLAESGIGGEQARLLDIIRRESKRLSDSLNSFLSQSRPVSPSVALDLKDVVAEAVTLLRNSPEVKAEHSIDFEADEGPHVCLADRYQISQVFWNLSRNALEAMPDGGRLTIRLRRREDVVVLSVRDEGRGLDREAQRRIFEPFRSGGGSGTGLGLAIVFRIVREHRGDISVKSAPLRGTEFEVHLPLVAAPVLA
jgi:two-component system sensor histidine kinase PilS (NtrC family)